MRLTFDELLRSATDAGDPPAAQLCIQHRGDVLFRAAHGSLPDGTPIDHSSRFDLASVTKVVTAMTAIARLPLDRPAGPASAPELTVAELLGHRSGLPEWKPLFLTARDDPEARSIFALGSAAPASAFARSEALVRAALDRVPAGPRRRVYSDLGFLALGHALERDGTARLEEVVDETLLGPLGLAGALAFHRLGGPPPQGRVPQGCVPTGRHRPRLPAPGQESLVLPPFTEVDLDPGAVDDGNAFACGGVAGHAGLFGTADAVATLGTRLLEELAGAAVVAPAERWRPIAEPDGDLEPLRTLGLDRPTPRLVGRFGSGPRGAIGHLGFTGCALWIDLDLGLSVALCTNRVWPGRVHVDGIRGLRPAIFDAAWELVS